MKNFILISIDTHHSYCADNLGFETINETFSSSMIASMINFSSFVIISFKTTEKSLSSLIILKMKEKDLTKLIPF